ncbi:hypothetical protein OIU84_006194, partial [Salix udensis]
MVELHPWGPGPNLYFSRARGWGLGTSFRFSKLAVFFFSVGRELAGPPPLIAPDDLLTRWAHQACFSSLLDSPVMYCCCYLSIKKPLAFPKKLKPTVLTSNATAKLPPSLPLSAESILSKSTLVPEEDLQLGVMFVKKLVEKASMKK